MGNLVQYQDWDDEELKEDKKKAEKEKAGKYLRYPADGRLRVRFLPPRLGEPRFLKVYEHFFKSDDDKWIKFVCPEKAGVRDCPICAEVRKLFATGVEADEKRAKDLLAKKNVYANVIDRDDEIFGPKIINLRSKQVGRLFEDENSIRDLKGNFTDPGEKGYDIILTKSGKGFKTKYDAFDSDRSPLGDMGWIDRQEDLRPLAVVLSGEELEEKYGIAPLEDDASSEAEELF